MSEKNQLQQSHDELATVLMTLLVQTIRGTHAPMVYQLDTAIEALRKSLPNIESDSPYRFKTGNASELLDELQERIHKMPTKTIDG